MLVNSVAAADYTCQFPESVEDTNSDAAERYAKKMLAKTYIAFLEHLDSVGISHALSLVC